jgi:hypothetical protein
MTKNNNATTNRVMARPHSLVMKHKSIFTILYYEWYGLENYMNTPVEGGLQCWRPGSSKMACLLLSSREAVFFKIE